MLTCTFGWRTLIPIRAIPYLTGGTFDARDVATLFFHLDMFEGESFYPSSRAFRICANGSTVPVTPAEWGLLSGYFRGKGNGPLLGPKHIRQLPAGAFVWRRPFKVLYGFLSSRDDAKDVLGLCEHAGSLFDWREDFPLTKKQQAIVWQDCSVGQNREGTSTGQEIALAEFAHVGVSAEPETSVIPTKALVKRKLTKHQMNRLICRQHATRYWKANPNLSQTDMLLMPEIARFVAMYKDRKTVPGWIRDLDPRPVGTRRGRPRRR